MVFQRPLSGLPGNQGRDQSGNGIVKRFSSSRCGYLVVLVGDGRRWFIPSGAVQGRTQIIAGGPKYAAYEVERGRAVAEMYSG